MVDPERLVNEGEGFGGTVQFAQHSSLQGTGLVVTTVEDEAAVQLVEGIVVTAIRHTDTGRLEVAGIGPDLIPSGFPEEFVSLM